MHLGNLPPPWPELAMHGATLVARSGKLVIPHRRLLPQTLRLPPRAETPFRRALVPAIPWPDPAARPRRKGVAPTRAFRDGVAERGGLPSATADHAGGVPDISRSASATGSDAPHPGAPAGARENRATIPPPLPGWNQGGGEFRWLAPTG